MTFNHCSHLVVSYRNATTAVLLLATTFLLAGCSVVAPAIPIDSAINRYGQVAGRIELGATRESVRALLDPTQSGLAQTLRKSSDQMLIRGSTVYIDYYRSSRIADGSTTDEEFTPYLYVDNQLVAVGWATVYGYLGSTQIGNASREVVQAQATYGTCFVLAGGGEIVTSNHVIEAGQTIRVSFVDGSSFTAQVATRSASTDLAILDIPGRRERGLVIAPGRSAIVGQEVFTMGFPAVGILGTEPKYTNGSISSLSGLQGEAAYMQISVPVQPGNSGGPLVSEDGQVLGVIAATAAVENFYRQSGSLPQNVNWAVKSEYVQVLLGNTTTADAGASSDSVLDLVSDSICQVESLP